MKKLVLMYIKTEADLILFKIMEQTHRNLNFGINNFNHFNASNDIKLVSISFPAMYLYSCEDDTLCCRGDNTNSSNDDDAILSVSPGMWEKIKVAVREYNTYFGNYCECILGEVIKDIVPMDMFIIE